MYKLLCEDIAKNIIEKNNFEDLSLFNGNSGFALLFYEMYQMTNDMKYKKYANLILDNIYKRINENIFNYFAYGSTGIGWSLNYLIQSQFVTGDVNEILEAVDHRVFKHIDNTPSIDFSFELGLSGYLTYLTMRLEKIPDKEMDIFIINSELLKKVINNLDVIFINNYTYLTKDIDFNLFWSFPTMIAKLSDAYKLNIYNYKIHNMINQWMNIIESHIPSLHINRLHFAISLQKLNQHLNQDKINNYICMLLFSIDPKKFYYEINMSTPTIQKGWIGLIYLLNEYIKNFSSDYPCYTPINNLRKELIDSLDRRLNMQLNFFKSEKLGISNGIGGFAWSYLKHSEIYNI